MHIVVLFHIPSEGNFASDNRQSLYVDRSFRRLHIAHTQLSWYGIAHIVGSIYSGEGYHTSRDVGNVDSRQSVGWGDVLVGEQSPLHRRVAGAVIHGHITHKVVLDGILTEMDVCPHLSGGVLEVRTLYEDLGDNWRQWRHEVGETDGQRF